MRLEKTLAISATTMLVMAIMAITIFGVGNSETEDSKYKSFKLYEKICAEHYRNGVLVQDPVCTHNLVTNQGFEMIESDLTGTGNTGTVSYIALGNRTTPAAGDTLLDFEVVGCGLGRAQGTKVDRGTGNWSYTNVFTSTCSITTINTTAIFNDTVAVAGNSTLASAAFGTAISNIAPNDQINVTWYACVAASACLS